MMLPTGTQAIGVLFATLLSTCAILCREMPQEIHRPHGFKASKFIRAQNMTRNI